MVFSFLPKKYYWKLMRYERYGMLALMFANAALVRSGWRPTGPLTRALDRLSAALAPAGDRVWRVLRKLIH